MTKMDYYRRLFRIFFAYRGKKTRLDYLPIRLWVEPTNCCNLACVMCPNKSLPEEKKGYMEFALFQKVIDEARHFVFDVNLLHRGESLLHPEFLRMVRYAHEAGLFTKFHTNGTLLDESKSHELIDSGIDQFTFSFDGYDQKTYESIRVNAGFEKTVGNILGFLQIKKSLRSKKPYTILELINFPEIYRHVSRVQRREFLNRFKGLPLDKVIVKEIHNWAGEIAPPRGSKRYLPCTFLWQALVIFWDGEVLPCAQDFQGYYSLGNIRNSKLDEIWNGKRLVTLRKRILERDIEGLKTCAGCDRLWRDQIFGIPKENLWKFVFKKMP
jgi:radical SAM protein with 4Fe4S-binding SPASM domain